MARTQRQLYEAIGVVLLVVTAVPALAALDPKLEEWGKGPAQWIMTPEEQRSKSMRF